ncbi:PIR Superfamily Protein [Plasmodium ovale wallikeri]|uniref:PIR Superfamily Protein n=1 Tax=Plasmodium ovale wallikeri TaxID=864142 RepID=A0A1A8Z841_PLAOA|nr:PIR Superfamily Protein [Plasmodium ovale wallikeri]SBT40024.1 PIR Superfamily Protein [Plasmodium ovale wallikeri]
MYNLPKNVHRRLKDNNNCDLPSERIYNNFDNVETSETYKSLFQGNSSITYIIILHTIWDQIIYAHYSSKKDICSPKYFSSIGADYIKKWEKMHNYNNNYKQLETAFNSKENCKEKYCNDIADVTNIYNEFVHVCNGENKQRCPYFGGIFQKNYEEASRIEQQFVVPILLILLFYFFMKKLSLFGSKISPRVDNLRKMWRNAQGVTNPATLLHLPKPPLGGNKMSLLYMPK